MQTSSTAIIAGIALAAQAAIGFAAHAEPSPPERETVRVPGTTVTFDLVRVPGLGAGGGPLWAGETEVTWDLYDIYLYRLDADGDDDGGDTGADAISRPSKPYVPPDRGYGHAGYPAMGMTRHAAAEFCRWLSEATGDTYRLPTRAEWTSLAEAGGGATGGVWHEDNADYTTRPVGKQTPNAFGLHDMLGNVAEWIAPAPGERPKDNPVAMGGSFLDPRARCTPTVALPQRPGWNASDPQIPKSRWWLADCDFVGFRIVRGAEGEPANDTPREEQD